MKICPKCKNEYREGITHCADCGCELINEGEEKQAVKLILEAPYPVIKKAMEYLEYCKFKTVTMEEPNEEGLAALYCSEKEHKDAVKQVSVLIQEEQKKALEEQLANMEAVDLEEMQEEEELPVPPSTVYQNYESKAEENKSSAISFLVIGALGCVVVALSWFGMLPFSIGGKGNWFSHGVMFAFFVIFFIIGIVSAKSVGKYKALADKEADTQNELEKYLEEQFALEVLSGIEADTEEEAYFKRMTFMREKVAEDFPEESENAVFVESLLDVHYDKIFG